MRYVRIRDSTGEIREGEWTDDGIRVRDEWFQVGDVDLLSPVAPGKVVCAARNYKEGISDGENNPNQPVLFLKTPNTITGPGSEVALPTDQGVLFEGELGVVINERCRNVSERDAMDVVSGFTCANDITNGAAENIVRRKSFDNAAPIGPAVVSPDQVPADATIEVRINSEIKQKSSIDDLIFDVPTLITSISADLTLEEGDMILTGSPPGRGQLEDEDRVTIQIEGVGTLEHTVTV